MGSMLCCLSGSGDTYCCFCLPWPFVNNGHSGSAARQRGDTRVAPDYGSVPLASCADTGQVDPMDTFCSPPRPLPYDYPQFSHQTQQHSVAAEHDKASTQFQKPSQLTASKNVDIGSTCKAQKVDGSSVKYHTGSQRIDGTQIFASSDNEDDCPICLEEYHFENPKIELQCNHNFHLSCIYEWMERSQACPVCAKVMLFNEDE
ncbi:hypothetical protein ACP70R_045745 [Stipagrostis hirtigluma subsp. patula]